MRLNFTCGMKKILSSIPLYLKRLSKMKIFVSILSSRSCAMWKVFCRLASSLCHHVSTLLGLRWELRGREHLEKDRACIIVANHQSSLDVLGMFDLWPVMDKCTVVAKKEIFYAWPVGLGAWLCGLIFIDRMNSEKARSVLNTATQEIRDKKVKSCAWIALIITISFLLLLMLRRSNCGYFPRAPDTTPVRYTLSRRVPSMSQSNRNCLYYRLYSPLIISCPQKRRDLILVRNCEVNRTEYRES